MVGVRGKYKGCNTCRDRRVKCDNERPICRRCRKGHRKCGGYERETVFIIGTIEDQGRCSSHPPRVVRNRQRRMETTLSPQTEPKTEQQGTKVDNGREIEDKNLPELVVTEPLHPAWAGSCVSVLHRGKPYRLRIAVLNTKLDAITRTKTNDTGVGNAERNATYLSLPTYELPGGQKGEFQLGAQCLAHLPDANDNQGDNNFLAAEGTCLFLYERTSHVQANIQSQIVDTSPQDNIVQRMGPESFRFFPNHHFFARVYRPNAIYSCLLARQSTFLAEPAWQTVPYEQHQKSDFDHVLDVIARLTGIVARAENLLTFPQGQPQAISRSSMAHDLLQELKHVDSELTGWSEKLFGFGSLSQASCGGIPRPSSTSTITNFSTSHFPDQLTALTLVYCWTALIMLCVTAVRLRSLAAPERVADGTGSGASSVLGPTALVTSTPTAYEFTFRYPSGHNYPFPGSVSAPAPVQTSCTTASYIPVCDSQAPNSQPSHALTTSLLHSGGTSGATTHWQNIVVHQFPDSINNNTSILAAPDPLSIPTAPQTKAEPTSQLISTKPPHFSPARMRHLAILACCALEFLLDGEVRIGLNHTASDVRGGNQGNEKDNHNDDSEGREKKRRRLRNSISLQTQPETLGATQPGLLCWPFMVVRRFWEKVANRSSAQRPTVQSASAGIASTCRSFEPSYVGANLDSSNQKTSTYSTAQSTTSPLPLFSTGSAGDASGKYGSIQPCSQFLSHASLPSSTQCHPTLLETRSSPALLTTSTSLSASTPSPGGGDGRAELHWCEAFKARLLARGRALQEELIGTETNDTKRSWIDLATWI